MFQGCRVIGFAGTDDKVDWLVNELGFDAAFNYKSTDVKRSLKEAAPSGVDCYFDNVWRFFATRFTYQFIDIFFRQVGGHLSAAVRSHMNHFGRISVCGAIALYNDTAPTLSPCIEPILVFKQIKMEGFLVHRWLDRFQEGMDQMSTWIQEVRLVLSLIVDYVNTQVFLSF